MWYVPHIKCYGVVVLRKNGPLINVTWVAVANAPPIGQGKTTVWSKVFLTGKTQFSNRYPVLSSLTYSIQVRRCRRRT